MGTEEDIMVMAELVRLSLKYFGSLFICKSFKRVYQVQDNTKSLKGIVVDWITPRNAPLLPPLSWNIKTNRAFHHPVTGQLLCPTGLDWSDDE